MKISIITAVRNGVSSIGDCIESVQNQTYPVEHIIIDGGSTDGTIEIVNKYRDRISKFISEQDKGIYDGMNKGIKIATGDIIGILNSDDVYADETVIEEVVKAMEGKNADVCWGDLVYVKKNDTDNIVRYWKSSAYKSGRFKRGWMPPHPTFFVRKSVYEKYGYFNLDFPIAADYEIMLRFLERYKISSYYIPKFLVKMRAGGRSNKSLLNIIRANIQCYKAWEVNGLSVNPLVFLIKPASKTFQFSIFSKGRDSA
ncbi:MAG: glycosyl transferase [Desulfobacteraceae bacterium 4484_190.3]|nr:MAG: glycosyl transferase [Desulfobacteraceae bacterium 4484_190.3]